MRLFISTFLILIFAANQSFAALCADACETNSGNVKSEVADSSSSSSDCHGSKKPEKSMPSQDCEMAFCADTAIQAQVLIDQVKEKDGIKKILIRGEVVSPEIALRDQVRILAYSKTPLPQKIRIHLLLQHLII